jgi:hypothetical protein
VKKTNEVQPLLIWTDERPTPSDIEKLKRAKQSLGIAVSVIPRKAFVGCNGRVLAVGQKPDWICDYAYIDSFDDPALTKKLKWIILGDEGTGQIPGPVRTLDMLRAILGEGVTEITEEQI